MSNDAKRLARDLGNSLSYDYDEGRSVVATKLLTRERISLQVVAADSAANTTLSANVQYSAAMLRAGRVVSGVGVVGSNVTANASNYKVISIADQSGAVLATQNTQPTANGGTGNLVAGTPFTIEANTTTDNSARFAAGDVLYVTTAVGGTGVQMPLTAYYVDVEWEGA